MESNPEELVRFLATSLVDSPDDVVVASQDTEDGLVITITTHPDEVGKVIGRGGRTIKSIRTLARAIAGQGGCQVEVDN
jgi:predicted RNA-binding protein YlqC (UPF0109 family)